MSRWRSRRGAERVIVDAIGPVWLVHSAGDPAAALTAMAGALPPEPGRIAVVTAPSVTARSDCLRIVGQIIDDRMQGNDAGVRLVALGHAADPEAAESQVRALSQDVDREVVAPLGALTVGADGTVAVAAPSLAGGGWVTCAPGAPPYYEPAWFPQPAWAKDLPPETARVSVHGAAATYPVPAGYWILPRGATPGRAGAASVIAPDRTVATVFLGGFGALPLALDDVALSLAALPMPDRYRLVLLPGALRDRADAVDLRECCDPAVQILAGVPVWSGGSAWSLAFVGATGGVTTRPSYGRDRAVVQPGPRDGQDLQPARRDRPAPGRRDRGPFRVGGQTAAGWSFVAGAEPVGVVPTPAGLVVEVNMDATGFRVHGKSVTPGELADLIALACPLRRRTVVVVVHGTPPSGQVADASFGMLASILGGVVIAADSEVSMSRAGLLHTSGRFWSWHAQPAEPGTAAQVLPPAALGDTLPPLPTAAASVPDRLELAAPPAPAARATQRAVTTQAGPRWITAGSCNTQDQLRLRQLLDGEYETHARMVVRQLFQDQGPHEGQPSAATVTGLVAVRAYCATERDTVNDVLRRAGPVPDGAASTLVAECAMYGLGQLPVVSGPVFATCPIPVPVAAYETGVEFVEPAFVDVRLSPNHGPGDGVDYQIWSHSAREVGSIAPDGRATALFAAGSRFLVLGVEAGPVRPRVMLLDLAAPDGRREGVPGAGLRAEDIVEVLRHSRFPAGGDPGPDPQPLAFPVGLDLSGRPYRRHGHRPGAAAPPAVEPRQRAGQVSGLRRRPGRPGGNAAALPPADEQQSRTDQAEAGGVVVVSAVGVPAAVRLAPPARPRWLYPGAPEPAAVLPAVLGEDGQRRLFLDLATVPGVLTVTGALPQCRRYAQAIAAQLSGRGCHVIVVGGALDTVVAPGWQRRPEFPDIHAADAGSGIVITEGLRGAALQRARSLSRRTEGRYVAVVIGEVLRSRWSVSVEGTGW